MPTPPPALARRVTAPLRTPVWTTAASILLTALVAIGCGFSKAPVGRDVGIASSGGYAAVTPPAPAAERLQLAGGSRGALGGVVGEAPGPGQAVPPGASGQPVDPVSYLAYAYGLRLELPGERLIGVMDRHVAACRDAGLRVCQLVSSRRDGDPGDALHGTVSLRAEPRWLQQFMRSVQGDAREADGRVTAQWTTTEDLTREIVDTEATLRAKRALRDRLQQLLASRPGRLSDLLEVERELARVQGEIDATESNLTAMRTRVAMSALTIEYGSTARAMATGTFAPLRLALVAFVEALVESSAALITAVGALLPWAVTLTLMIWALIRIWRRRSARSPNPAEPPPA